MLGRLLDHDLAMEELAGGAVGEDLDGEGAAAPTRRHVPLKTSEKNPRPIFSSLSTSYLCR